MSQNTARKLLEEELTEDVDEIGFLDLEDDEIEMIEPLELVKSDEEEDLDDLHLMHMPATASIRSRVAEVPLCGDPARALIRSQIPIEAFESEPDAALVVLDARWELYQWACKDPDARCSEDLVRARKKLFAHVPMGDGLLAQWRRAVVMISESL